MSGVVSIVAGVGMAVGPPLAYADQYVSICKKHDSLGFSLDVTAILILANLTRCFYWLGEHFQLVLLIQSLLMIMAQYGLLYVCLLYRPAEWFASRPRRLANFWQWPHFGAYLEFTAIFIVIHSALFLLLHSWDFYVQLLGFIALGVEATLPIPQLIANYEAKSTAGFRMSVLAAWAFGDTFKLLYYLFTPDNGLQFKLCGAFQLTVDILLCLQTFLYRHKTAQDLSERASLRQHRGVAGTDSLLAHSQHALGDDDDDDETGTEGEAERRGFTAPQRPKDVAMV
ncbi:Any1p [Rhodotorula paludigena]|uniref:Any1p n=1 Tax=Rhodotorula paludigena TaxID=86838 RepID=UPI00316FFDA5